MILLISLDPSYSGISSLGSICFYLQSYKIVLIHLNLEYPLLGITHVIIRKSKSNFLNPSFLGISSLGSKMKTEKTFPKGTVLIHLILENILWDNSKLAASGDDSVLIHLRLEFPL